MNPFILIDMSADIESGKYMKLPGSLSVIMAVIVSALKIDNLLLIYIYQGVLSQTKKDNKM